MFLQERYRRQPWKRPAPAPDAEIERAAEVEEDGPIEGEQPDVPIEDERLTDAAFLEALRTDVEGVQAGTLPSFIAAQRQIPKDRPWGRHHKRRDKRGEAF